MFFASDNWAGAAPEIVEAVAREASRFGTAYGESEIDRAVEKKFADIFEREVAVFFVATGSAANGLALASVNRPGGVVFCHQNSHILEDECGGVEYLTGGARLAGVEGHAGRIDPQRLAAAIGRFPPGFVHAGQSMAVSITQTSEAGTVYGIDQIRAVSAIAREHGLPLHMDGARFANALSHLVVSPAEMTWKAGVDVLSFGGTKNGCIGAEALVFFDPAKAAEAPYLRKRAGQLFSKARFIAAQFDAYFRDGLWLHMARHANSMATRLKAGLAASGRAREAWPTQGNEVFVVLRRSDVERLRGAGAAFHDWAVPHGAALDLAADETLVRLVTSFVTAQDEIGGFLELLSRRA
jgi:threonine aldolase